MLPLVDDFGRYSVFLDFDGTLVEIADRPDDVYVDDSTLRMLEAMLSKVGGAVALISWRDIEVVDRLLYPLVLPVAGVHGLQRRDAAGLLHPTIIDQQMMDAITAEIEKALGQEPGVIVEKKFGAVALHSRLRPDFEARCHALAREIVRDRPALTLAQGKMVSEIKFEGNDKAAVIEAFLNEAPFNGRIPIFAGDDATDESGFSAVNTRGGISIKIGKGPASAKFRAGSVLEFRAWLEELATTPKRAGVL